MIDTYIISDCFAEKDNLIPRVNPKYIDKRLVKKYVSVELSIVDISCILTHILVFKKVLASSRDYLDGIFVLDDKYNINKFQSKILPSYLEYDITLIGSYQIPAYFIKRDCIEKFLFDIPITKPFFTYVTEEYNYDIQKQLFFAKKDVWNDLFS